jgi:hypothetical protein
MVIIMKSSSARAPITLQLNLSIILPAVLVGLFACQGTPSSDEISAAGDPQGSSAAVEPDTGTRSEGSEGEQEESLTRLRKMQKDLEDLEAANLRSERDLADSKARLAALRANIPGANKGRNVIRGDADGPWEEWKTNSLSTPSKRFNYIGADQGSSAASAEVLSIDWRKRRWIFDRHGSEYYYTEPDKGNTLIVFDFLISTKLHAPLLPAFYLFRLPSTRQPEILGRFLVNFFRWSDYGAYLGNYADFKNSFSKNETVKFTGSLEVSEEYSKEPLVLVASRHGCAKRQHDQFATPPVRYQFQDCDIEASDLASATAFWEKYQLVAVHNLKALPQ